MIEIVGVIILLGALFAIYKSFFKKTAVQKQLDKLEEQATIVKKRVEEREETLEGAMDEYEKAKKRFDNSGNNTES